MARTRNQKRKPVDHRMISSPKHVQMINGSPQRVTKAHRKAISNHKSHKLSAPEIIDALTSGHQKVLNFIKRGTLIQARAHLSS